MKLQVIGMMVILSLSVPSCQGEQSRFNNAEQSIEDVNQTENSWNKKNLGVLAGAMGAVAATFIAVSSSPKNLSTLLSAFEKNIKSVNQQVKAFDIDILKLKKLTKINEHLEWQAMRGGDGVYLVDRARRVLLKFDLPKVTKKKQVVTISNASDDILGTLHRQGRFGHRHWILRSPDGDFLADIPESNVAKELMVGKQAVKIDAEAMKRSAIGSDVLKVVVDSLNRELVNQRAVHHSLNTLSAILGSILGYEARPLVHHFASGSTLDHIFQSVDNFSLRNQSRLLTFIADHHSFYPKEVLKHYLDTLHTLSKHMKIYDQGHSVFWHGVSRHTDVVAKEAHLRLQDVQGLPEQLKFLYGTNFQPKFSLYK